MMCMSKSGIEEATDGAHSNTAQANDTTSSMARAWVQSGRTFTMLKVEPGRAQLCPDAA